MTVGTFNNPGLTYYLFEAPGLYNPGAVCVDYGRPSFLGRDQYFQLFSKSPESLYCVPPAFKPDRCVIAVKANSTNQCILSISYMPSDALYAMVTYTEIL